MLRAVSKLCRASPVEVANLRRAALSTSSAKCSGAEATEEDPEFLEMVTMFAENAHALTLDKLLTSKPSPGKAPVDASTREHQIRGKKTNYSGLPSI